MYDLEELQWLLENTYQDIGIMETVKRLDQRKPIDINSLKDLEQESGYTKEFIDFMEGGLD